MSKNRRFGLLCVIAVLAPSLGWWYASPRAAQALGMPLAWAGLSGESRLDGSHWSGGVVAIEPAQPHDPLPSSETLGDRVLAPSQTLGAVSRGLPSVGGVAPASAMYSSNQVMRWAFDRSPEARLIETEVEAVMRNVDPKDPDQCCSGRLIRNVLREVALARRYDDATHAAVAYHKLIAATEAIVFADQAIETTDRLISMADEAARLELPDGSPLKLRQSRAGLLSLKTEQTFNTLKLRQELSRLTGRSEAEVATAIMTDSLPNDAPMIIAGVAVETATAQRRDLQAVKVLCQELQSCNVDAARLLMGIVSPGVGLSLATATKGLFQCLKEDKSEDDLSARRRQCCQLKDSLEVVIRNETLQAVLDVRSAGARLRLIDEQLQFASQRLEETRGKINIEDAAPGSDLLIEIELSELRGKRLAIQKELALAIDDLEHAKSTPIQSSVQSDPSVTHTMH